MPCDSARERKLKTAVEEEEGKGGQRTGEKKIENCRGGRERKRRPENWPLSISEGDVELNLLP